MFTHSRPCQRASQFHARRPQAFEVRDRREGSVGASLGSLIAEVDFTDWLQPRCQGPRVVSSDTLQELDPGRESETET